MKDKVRTANTVRVNLDGYLYLQQKCHQERCGKPISEKGIERLKKNFERFSAQGWKTLMDGDFGGCIGSPENSWEERRWTNWSAEDMIRILTEAGIPCERGESQEVIDVYI